MRNLGRLAVGTVAAATAVAIGTVGAGPAAAATTFSFTVGGVGSGHPLVTGANVGNFSFTDTAAHQTVTCTKFGGSGPTNPGTGIPFAPAVANGTGTSVADLVPTSGDISGCTNPIAGVVTLTPSGTWHVYATGPVAGSTTEWYGYVANIQKHVTAAGCAFDASGVYDGIIDTATSTIVPNTSGPNAGRLTISNVTGAVCSIIGLHNGDSVSVQGTLQFSPTVAITSP